MKILLPLLCLLASGGGVVLVKGGRKVSERDLLRGYGFASCMEAAYKGSPIEKDASRVAELYREVGSTKRMEVYAAIDRAAAASDPAQPAMKDGANLAIMSCLEFYEGATLSAAIRSAPGDKR
jgi:hypothetical protein